ncbi:E3 ubiquitin-protein ligase RNF123 [Condylostylus longicornis]|uniref:E3 ubiquitin-protein ligase RNF123 n=1 Tax=Condylostylus longicornis TaxID=2530218 RepID=UPI00244DE2A3|nr:E3 ubiquitin-protein ligase RNF123 [Condylostylus longicornis]
MEINKIFQKIFGEQIFEGSLGDNVEEKRLLDSVFPEQIGHINYWLDAKLQQIEEQTNNIQRPNKIGPEKVVFDIQEFRENVVQVCSDRLTLKSHGTFNTVKANACVYGGKWMYEIQLHTKGVMQIGWCSNKCTFTADTGVGDTKLSYGFDGSKQQIWHVHTSKYGEKWQSGDILGICLDVDDETIEYYRNGVSMGVAFKTIEKGPGIALYPAVSLAFNEALRANFGSSPFRYPVKDFNPLQLKPIIELQKSDLLLGYIVNLAGILSSSKYRKDKLDITRKSYREGSKTENKKTGYILISSLLVEKLSVVLLDSYVIEEKFMLYVMNLCVLRSDSEKDTVILPGSVESTLGTLLSLFWSYMEAEEIQYLLKNLLNILWNMFSQTPKDLEYERQRKVIVILTCLCNHPQTRKFYINTKFFKKNCLPMFMYLKPPEYSVMVKLLPDEVVWTEGIGGAFSDYTAICDKLKKSVEILYGLQKNLLKILLTNEDGTNNSPSSRKSFIVKLRKYVMENSIEQRAIFLLQGNSVNLIESPVALSFLCILVDTTRSLFEKELGDVDIFIDSKHFYDGSFRYQHFDRVGGVLSHLKKVHRSQILQQLGENGENILSAVEDRDLIRIDGIEVYSPPIVLIRNSSELSTFLGRAQGERRESDIIQYGDADSRQSLSELLDLSIIYYYAVGHKHIVKIASIRDEIANLTDVLLETKRCREDIEENVQALSNVAGNGFNTVQNEILNELKGKFGQRSSVFAKRSIELGRKQAWYRSVALGEYRREILIWLLDKTLKTLKCSSETGPLFSFVPEVYINILPILLDTILDFSFHDISMQFDVSDAESVVQIASEFLGLHAADPRIILASCKDSLLQALGTLTCHEAGIKAMEKNSSASQLSLVMALLRPYENRAWGQSNWLLLRFWLGDDHAFAYKESRMPSVWQGGKELPTLGLYRTRNRNETHTGLLHHIAPACPSRHFQTLIGKYLTDDEPFATSFMNSVLSQLNWAFSEFILLLQEIQNTSNRQEGQELVFEPRQLKICSMCFELTVSLMRSLEMVIRVAPSIFHDPNRANSDLILNRVAQLISQVLSRVTVPPGCFQHVIDLCLPDLSSVSHFAIISAALGILLALLKEEIEIRTLPDKITRVSRALLTDPSFQIAHLEYTLGEVKTPILYQVEIPRGNFDPKTRAHIDPLTNDVRVQMPTTSKKIRSDPPILKFSLNDYPSHVTNEEINAVKRLVETLSSKQSLLSDITLPSEDSLCPICCAKPVSVTFTPCLHQSCRNCILQHLMNSKVCFYCKTLIKDVKKSDGTVIFMNANYINIPEDV